MRIGKGKAALLAAVSTLAASAALSPAGASVDPAAYPAIVEAAPIQHGAMDADHNAPASAKKWALLAIAAGALAGIVKLVGARRVAGAVSTAAVATAKIGARAATGAVSAVGRAAASPLRYLSLLLGLALFALVGVDLTNMEWLGGVASGAALTAYGLYGVWKTRRALRPAPAKAPVRASMDNGN